MANLIITVIAIALVAIASLMGAYYGGAAFLQSAQAADASTVLNQGQQIAGAWTAYLSDNLNQTPANASALVTGNYIETWPMFPASAGGNSADYYAIVSVGGHYYAMAIVGLSGSNPGINDNNASACAKVIKTASGVQPTAIVTADIGTLVQGGTNIGNTNFGCGLVDLSTGFTILPNTIGLPTVPTSNAYVSYYFLS